MAKIHFHVQEWSINIERIGFIIIDQGANMLAAVGAYTDEDNSEAKSDDENVEEDDDYILAG